MGRTAHHLAYKSLILQNDLHALANIEYIQSTVDDYVLVRFFQYSIFLDMEIYIQPTSRSLGHFQSESR
jgi:hypothetical protein